MNNYNYIDPRSEIIDQIQSDERLLWADKPATGIKFRKTDIFIFLFSLLWLSFSLFWSYMAAKSSYIFALFGTPFILIGIHLLVGRYFFDSISRKNTIYGLTNKRIIKKSGVYKKSYNSIFLTTLPSLSYTEESDGSVDISFGQTIESFKKSRNNNRSNFPIARIEFIPNVRNVHNKIADAKSKLELETKKNQEW